jgi:hypothetical protein
MFDVQISLADSRWEAITDGQFVGPGDVRWSRRSTRAKRSDCERRITDGAPLVLYYFAGGHLDWFDGSDAVAQCDLVRASVTHAPRRRGELQWTAGIWVDDAEHNVVLLTGHC